MLLTKEIKHRFIDVWIRPILFGFLVIIVASILYFYNIIGYENLKNLALLNIFIVSLYGLKNDEKWKKLNNYPRKYSNSQLQSLHDTENYQYVFYYSIWRKLFGFFIISICIIILIKYEAYENIILLFALGFLIFELLNTLKDIITKKPIVKISEKLIRLNGFGIISKDELTDIKFRRHYYKIVCYYYLDFYISNSKFKSANFSLLINNLKNRNKLLEILKIDKD